MALTYAEWADLVERLNAGFPRQQIDEFTAEVWYGTLRDYRREEVGRALATCVGAVEFISCHAIVQAIEDDRRSNAATRSTVLPLPAKGVGMPPETKEAIEVLKRSTLLPDNPDYLPPGKARARVEELADYLDRRLAEQSTAPRRDRLA